MIPAKRKRDIPEDVCRSETGTNDLRPSDTTDQKSEEKYHWSFDQNSKMHPRNKYCMNPPNFKQLAALYPDFGRYVNARKDGGAPSGCIDWRDPNATLALTKTLLRHDFDLDWELPEGFLCPPIPQRANYIHWIEDLLAGPLQCAISHPRELRIPQNAVGVDIGVGASCIFPLLALRLHPTWSFIASDINHDAIKAAQANIDRNGLGAPQHSTPASPSQDGTHNCARQPPPQA
jgi:hypothetical protein